MAFICNALCKVSPEKALKRFVPMLIQAIRTEIDDNGAASTRNTGSDVLPRDRGLVWNVSMLSMCVVHVGDAVVNHKNELFDIALYMQQNCKGIPTIHISNFIHHLLLNLTVTYTIDYALYEPIVSQRGLQPDDWGQSPKPTELSIKWHVPSQEEIEFAVKLFKSQADAAVSQLSLLISENSPIKRDGTAKEWSDEVSRNLVLLRLILSGVSVLFDPKAASKNGAEENLASMEDAEITNANGSANGHMDYEKAADDAVLGETDEDEIKSTFRYPAGYCLEEGSSLYVTLHDLREQIGGLLHEVHRFLTEKQEDDVACFTALYQAFRAWFVDVGIERSAHVLDRVTRLLAADIHVYKVSGLRKEYPRPLLLKRANVYHLQRARHNAAPRMKSRLDRQLLLDLAESSLSLYTDIRKNAQSAGESALKVIIGGRPLVIPPVLDAFAKAIDDNDFPRIKGALYTLLYGSLAKTIGRDWRFTPSLIRSFIAATTADKPSIQKLASGVTYLVMEFGRPAQKAVILDKDVVKALAPPVDLSCQIEKKQKLIDKRLHRIEAKKEDLALELVDLAGKSHWKKASRTAAIVINLGLRFESIASEEMVELVTNGTIDTHPGLRGLYSGALVYVSFLTMSGR
jgi:proteasome activator subunit 4